jgi:anti-anti-sigma factor
MTAFSANVRRTDGSTRLELAGDLDLCAHAMFRDAYRSALATSRSGLIMDLSALEFCDLAGQRALLRCRAHVLVGAPAIVQRLFELTGHSELLSVDLRAEALHLPIRGRCPVLASAVLQPV